MVDILLTITSCEDAKLSILRLQEGLESNRRLTQNRCAQQSPFPNASAQTEGHGAAPSTDTTTIMDGLPRPPPRIVTVATGVAQNVETQRPADSPRRKRPRTSGPAANDSGVCPVIPSTDSREQTNTHRTPATNGGATNNSSLPPPAQSVIRNAPPTTSIPTRDNAQPIANMQPTCTAPINAETTANAGSTTDSQSLSNMESTGTAPSTSTVPSLSPAHCITLFWVQCTRKHKSCHNSIYIDKPYAVVNNSSCHLVGRSRVANVDDFLATRASTLFAVYREYLCDLPSASDSEIRKQERYVREVIAVVSNDLYQAMEGLSKFAPDRDSYRGITQVNQQLIPCPLTEAPSEYSRAFLYHHRKEVTEGAAAAPGSPLARLSEWLAANPDPMMATINRLYAANLVSERILEYMFSPNSMVVFLHNDVRQFRVLLNFPSISSTGQLCLPCWNWRFDGQGLTRDCKTQIVNIPRGNTFSLATLEVRPVRPADHLSQQFKQQECFGDIWPFDQHRIMSYEGYDCSKRLSYPPQSRFIEDPRKYSVWCQATSSPNAAQIAKDRFDMWPERVPYSGHLPPDQRLLLPAGTPAFSIKDKVWVQIRTFRYRSPTWNASSFEQVLLPERTKSLIKDLVMIRTMKSDSRKIISRDETLGLMIDSGFRSMILFHGGVGTGKTFTAAELARMPLFRLGYEDFNSQVNANENRRWDTSFAADSNCILFIEDVDTHFEDDSACLVPRSARILKLRRIIERYKGVIIIESRNPGAFDESFRAEIQLSVYFAPLHPDSRKKIWQNSLLAVRASKQRVDYDGIEAHMEDLSMYELNGRQIRNTLALARKAALRSDEVLTWERLRDAVEQRES
ncbi:hypothetical protein NLG97_g3793 [Lecanicillium saksenae]|uniref:Uncharacterized protein n=1 Tax=Lecanicillium saksenae TaxID=468837 RepID=A0ACC1QX69_9HYPO|nr:hypothetical protein NLG97_g3793 [Lecanicillium saksenae]